MKFYIFTRATEKFVVATHHIISVELYSETVSSLHMVSGRRLLVDGSLDEIYERLT